MKKTINVKPVDEIVLQFESGESLTLRFDVEALTHFDDLDGGLKSFFNEDKIPERCAKILYIGTKSSNPNFTYEKARAIVSELSLPTITEIINEFNESMVTTKDGVQSELSKKLIAQFLNKIMK